jgi:hypothetical protein
MRPHVMGAKMGATTAAQGGTARHIAAARRSPETVLLTRDRSMLGHLGLCR